MTTESQPAPIPQVCAIPFRSDGEQVEFCLITSLKRKLWIFPKGIIDPGETPVETALKESFEEAGLHGHILGEPLGSYDDAKWGTTLHVTVMLMQVTRCDDFWPEADHRERRWVAADLAVELLSKEPHRQYASLAIRRIAAGLGSSGKTI